MLNTWREYIQDRFSDSQYWEITESGDVVIVSFTAFRNENKRLYIIFLLSEKFLKNIYINNSNSEIVLDFATYLGNNSIGKYNFSDDIIKCVSNYLDGIIFDGWYEKIYKYNDKIYKIIINFKNNPNPFVYRYSIFKNVSFYLSLYKDMIFKDLDEWFQVSPHVTEEEKQIYPVL